MTICEPQFEIGGLPNMQSAPSINPAVQISDRALKRDNGRQAPDGCGGKRGARRRRFTAEYKLKVLDAYDAAPDGEKGAILRAEGLYSSHIAGWRKARDAGGFAALAAARGPKPRGGQAVEIAGLRAEKQRLEQQLEKTRAVVDVQMKLTRTLADALRERGGRSHVEAATDRAVTALTPKLGVRAACALFGVAQASYYRRHRQRPTAPRTGSSWERPIRDPRAANNIERQPTRNVQSRRRFADITPGRW